MCEYFAIRPADGKALPLRTVSARLLGLGLRENGALGCWLTDGATDNMQVNAEANASGTFAAAPDDLVLSLDVTRWCPHSGRTARSPGLPTLRAQEALLESVAGALGWTVVGQDDPDY
jgi:hypothetical protein